MTDSPRALPFDYNDEVFRHGTEGQGLDYSILRDEYRDIHPWVADRFAASGVKPVLDMGCGPTILGRKLDERGVPWVGIDPRLRGCATPPGRVCSGMHSVCRSQTRRSAA